VAGGERLAEVALRDVVVRAGLAVEADAHRVGVRAVQGEDRRRDAGRVRPAAGLAGLHVEHADDLGGDRDLVAALALRPHERGRDLLLGGDRSGLAGVARQGHHDRRAALMLDRSGIDGRQRRRALDLAASALRVLRLHSVRPHRVDGVCDGVLVAGGQRVGRAFLRDSESRAPL